MFYKVVILDYIDHTKGVLVEAGVMLGNFLGHPMYW